MLKTAKHYPVAVEGKGHRHVPPLSDSVVDVAVVGVWVRSLEEGGVPYVIELLLTICHIGKP